MPNAKTFLSNVKAKPTEKKWIIARRTKKDLIDQILINRRIDLKDKTTFLNPDFEHGLKSPFLLKNLRPSVDRLTNAILTKETIGIFADYDVDGVTSAALLFRALGKFNLEPIIYIPSREDGYGLNKNGIDYFKQNGVSLMMALDMGVSGKKEIEYARRLGIDSIVIDHHLVQKAKLPETLIVNPKQAGDSYPFKEFCACGLTYKFIVGLAKKFPKFITSKDLKWWLDLTAIATIADMVSLRGENRILVYYGLVVLQKTKNIGLTSLFQAGGINQALINPGTIGFQIAPRLNAPGRIEHANLAFELLICQTRERAQKLAAQIQKINSARQQELEKILEQAKRQVRDKNLDRFKIILVSGEKWSIGLVGLVAGKLMEEFARPAVVLSRSGKLFRGSARSIEAFHLLDGFSHVAKNLKSFGGHARAGGLTLEARHLDLVYNKLQEYAEGKIKDDDLKIKLTIDAEISPDKLTLTLIRRLAELEPFGFGNPKPLLVMRSQIIAQVKKVGNLGQHFKIYFQRHSGIYFNGSVNLNELKSGDKVDIVFYPQINVWNSRQYVDLIIYDIKKA